jgi:hypothetical protein
MAGRFRHPLSRFTESPETARIILSDHFVLSSTEAAESHPGSRQDRRLAIQRLWLSRGWGEPLALKRLCLERG